MTEKREQWLQVFKLLMVVVCASLYAFGGLESLVLRRYVASAICCLTIFYITGSFWALIQYPLMCVSLSLGYGSDVLIWKIIKRFIYGLTNAATGSFNGIMISHYSDEKSWFIISFHAVLVVSAFIVFGVWNPFNSARIEETVLGCIVFLLPIMSAKKE